MEESGFCCFKQFIHAFYRKMHTLLTSISLQAQERSTCYSEYLMGTEGEKWRTIRRSTWKTASALMNTSPRTKSLKDSDKAS